MYFLGNIWRAKYTKYIKYILDKYGQKYIGKNVFT